VLIYHKSFCKLTANTNIILAKTKSPVNIGSESNLPSLQRFLSSFPLSLQDRISVASEFLDLMSSSEMEMYYRGKSRAIAIIDIIWSSVGLGSTILTFFGLAVVTQQQNERGDYRKIPYENPEGEEGSNNEFYFNSKRTTSTQVNMFANVMLGVVMIVMTIITIQLVAAIRLLKACDIQTDSHKSLKNCRFWCGVTIFFVVIIGLNLFTPGRISVPGQIFSMAQILFRALGLYYVSEFMKEMTHGPILPMTTDIFAPHSHSGQAAPRHVYPKPGPPSYHQEEAPPPYSVSEAPPPYEHVGKI
jgi:magnesium-transporting ATPase (P-type)